MTNTPFYDVGIVAIDYFKAYAGALKHGTARAASAAKAALARKSGSGAKWKQAVIVYQGARGVIGEVLGVNDCTRAITGK